MSKNHRQRAAEKAANHIANLKHDITLRDSSLQRPILLKQKDQLQQRIRELQAAHDGLDNTVAAAQLRIEELTKQLKAETEKVDRAEKLAASYLAKLAEAGLAAGATE